MKQQKLKGVIIDDEDMTRYFDKEGNELEEGDIICWEDGRTEKLYLTIDGRLGTDATNPSWIESGRAIPCQYGIYALNYIDIKEIVKKVICR